MICNNCKRENNDGYNHCIYCGNSLINQQYQDPQTKETFSKGKKIVIISLLLVIICILSVLIFTSNASNGRTIMIYIDGSNLEYDAGIATADLLAIDASKIDLNTTNVLVYTGGTKEWLNDFVSNEENAIFKLTNDGYKKVKTYGQENMGDPNTLSTFINYVYDNYKAGYYDLILYDHGGAIDGAIYDDFTNDNLTLADFSTAMKNSPFNSNNKLETVLFRTCLNGGLEMTSIFEPYSKYIVFSEEISYGANITDVLSFINKVDSSSDGEEYGIQFVNQYKNQMSVIDPFGTSGVTYSVIDLSKVKNIYTELDKFISGVDIKKYYNEISKYRANMYQYGGSSTNMYDTVDLYTLVDGLSKYSSSSVEPLKTAIKDAIVYNFSNMDNSNGISIFFPYKGRGYRKEFLKVYKDDLSFSENYRNFITSFYSVQTESTSFGFNYTSNKVETDNKTREVSIQLTDEQLKNYSYSAYTVFERDEEHPNYYKIIYKSNDAKLSSDGKLTTNISNNLITVAGETEEKFIPVMHNSTDELEEYYTTGIMVDRDEDFSSKKYSYNSWVLFTFNNDKPVVGAAKVSYSADERVIGTMLDLNKYNFLTLYMRDYKLLDEKGNLLEEYESAPILTGVEGTFEELDFKKSTLKNGNYYVVFDIVDVNNEVSKSKLIKVGE